VTFLVERLAELRRHLDHLRAIRPRVASADALRSDLSLHNDVMFSLLAVAQLVIDIAGEICARRGLRFETYREAISNLATVPGFDPDLIEQLTRLPGFRNVLVHDYVRLDLARAVAALDDLEPIDRFLVAAAAFERNGGR
jgi:uncharacterized protein YutE (UPF0331/DUF86 family)